MDTLRGQSVSANTRVVPVEVGRASMAQIARLGRRHPTACGTDGNEPDYNPDDDPWDTSEEPGASSCWPPSGEHQAVKAAESDPGESRTVDPFDTQITKEEDPALVDTLEPPAPEEESSGAGKGPLGGVSDRPVPF